MCASIRNRASTNKLQILVLILDTVIKSVCDCRSHIYDYHHYRVRSQQGACEFGGTTLATPVIWNKTRICQMTASKQLQLWTKVRSLSTSTRTTQVHCNRNASVRCSSVLRLDSAIEHEITNRWECVAILCVVGDSLHLSNILFFFILAQACAALQGPFFS